MKSANSFGIALEENRETEKVNHLNPGNVVEI